MIGFLTCWLDAIRALALEALAAVDRLVATRLERHLCLLTALRAGHAEHLARRARTIPRPVKRAAAVVARRPIGFARTPAIRAPARFVLKSFLREELLLAGSKGKFLAAIDAGQ